MDCFKDIHPNQFGYKNKTSCKQAHYVVNEIINYYRQRGSKIYLISLDATKAFDRLWRDGLFYKLVDKVPKEIWRISLVLYYKESKIRVKYDGTLSEMVKCTEGVKQGGILSPYLFNFYINDLIVGCFEKNIGAEINNMNLSVLAYCDDLIIISPSHKHCEMLLSECDQYSHM